MCESEIEQNLTFIRKQPAVGFEGEPSPSCSIKYNLLQHGQLGVAVVGAPSVVLGG